MSDSTPAEKRKYMKSTYTKGSEAAKARGEKGAKTKAISPEHEQLLNDMFYDDKIQTGRDKTWRYLKSKYGPNEVDASGNLITRKYPTRPQVQKWLMKQPQYQIDRRPKQSKEIKSINHSVKKPRQLLFADLIQRGVGEKATYVLLVVDAFTKKIWTRSVARHKSKTKTPEGTWKVMKEILDEAGRNKYSKNHDSWVLYSVDNGKEFEGAFKDGMARKSITRVPMIPGRPYGNLSERYNQSFQNVAWKKTNAYRQQGRTRTDQIAYDLKESTADFNNLHNRATGMTPNEAERLDLSGIRLLATKLSSQVRPEAKNRNDVKVGDIVRRKNTAKYKGGTGTKYFTENFSRTLFTVYKVNTPRVLSTKAITYKLKTDDGKELPFNYTREDILLVPPDTKKVTVFKDEMDEIEETEMVLRSGAKKQKAKAKAPKAVKSLEWKFERNTRISAEKSWFDHETNEVEVKGARKEGKVTTYTTKANKDKVYYIKWDGEKSSLPYLREEVEVDEIQEIGAR